VGTAQLWVTHHVPMLFQMAIADNSTIQTPQRLFGGYAQPTVPGIMLNGIDIKEALATAESGTLTLEALLDGSFGGEVVTAPYGSGIHPVMDGQSIIVGLSTGGTGYGDPLDRDPSLVVRDVVWRKVSPEAALADYGVVLTGSIDDDSLSYDDAATALERASRPAPSGVFFDRGPGYARLSGGAEHAEVDMLDA